MASYTKVSASVPSLHRTALISSVAAGDQVDVEDVLGRPARGIKFEMTAATDTLQFKLNNLVRARQFNETSADTDVLIWSSGPQYSTYTSTGQKEHITENGILVSSFEVVALTLSTGTTISVVVW